LKKKSGMLQQSDTIVVLLNIYSLNSQIYVALTFLY
jgi:hypothetical protein